MVFSKFNNISSTSIHVICLHLKSLGWCENDSVLPSTWQQQWEVQCPIQPAILLLVLKAVLSDVNLQQVCHSEAPKSVGRGKRRQLQPKGIASLSQHQITIEDTLIEMMYMVDVSIHARSTKAARVPFLGYTLCMYLCILHVYALSMKYF